MKRRSIPLVLAMLALAASQIGCVQRRLTIRTNPPGAMAYVDGYPIGLTLNNDGKEGDAKASDDIFTYQIFLGGDIFATGTYLYELRAFDAAGNESNLWPYLEIVDDTNNN